MEKKIKQSGFLYKLDPKDYILGFNSPLKGIDINPSGDWISNRPADEQQYNISFDTMCCSTFSGTSDLETLLNFYLAKGEFSEAQIAWCKEKGYIEANGKFNFSDRWSAISNETMPNGQYVQKVWDDFRKNGLVPESVLPFGGNNQAEYLDKTKITAESKKLAKEFLEKIIDKDENGKYCINYEWLPVATGIELSAGLKQAPIQVAVSAENPAHAIMLLRMDMEFDTYAPFLRPRNRTIAYALKPIIKIKKDVPTKKLYKPANFSLSELVPKEVIAKLGEKAWELLDERMLKNLQFFRDTFGPVIVNTNFAQYRCFDPNAYRKEGLSQHNHGRGVDCTFKNITTKEIIEWLKIPANVSKLPYPDIWVELGVSHFHFDVRYSDKSGVYFFNP